MNWRVEFIWSPRESLGPFASVEYRMLAFGLAMSSPVGEPCRFFWISPPGGAGVSFV